MANSEHLAILKKGVKVWNVWRGQHRERPDLLCADLRRGKLSWADLHGADLSGASLLSADLSRAELSEANLSGAKLRDANLSSTHLSDANLSDADLRDANLSSAQLSGANLSGVNLSGAILSGADLTGADLKDTRFFETMIGNMDLSKASNLDSCIHHGPSAVDCRTLAQSGNLPQSFLRGVGFSDRLIEHIPSLFGKGIEFSSAFLSHNSGDKEFVRRLCDSLQGQGVRCWLDEKEIRPGDELYDKIDRGIQISDKLVLVLSEQSLTSWWVEHEWKKAMDKERRLRTERGKKVPAIIPIDIDGFIHSDECKITVKSEILSRAVADFTEWKDHDVFENALKGLIGALRADDEGRNPPPESKL